MNKFFCGSKHSLILRVIDLYCDNLPPVSMALVPSKLKLMENFAFGLYSAGKNETFSNTISEDVTSCPTC